MISRQRLCDISFLMYLMTTMAHCSGSGVDHVLSLGTFGIFVGFFVLYAVNKGTFHVDAFNGCMFVFLILIFASQIWAVYPDYVLSPVHSNILMEAPQMMIVSLFLASRIRKKEDIDLYIKLYLIAVAYMLISIIVRTPISDYSEGVRIGTVTGLWVNALAKIYIIALAFIYYIIRDFKGFKKFALIVMTGVLILYLFLTGSKNGILMFVAITFLVFFINGSFTGKFNAIIVTCLIAAVVLFLMFNVPVLYDIIGYRMEGFLDMIMYGDTSYDSSTETRSQLMGFAWQMFLERPALGWGFSNVAGYVADQRYFITTYAHSNYLELLADLGLVGTFVFYIPHVSALLKLIQVNKKSFIKGMALALLIVILVTDYISINITTIYYLVVIQMIYYIARCKEDGVIR